MIVPGPARVTFVPLDVTEADVASGTTWVGHVVPDMAPGESFGCLKLLAFPRSGRIALRWLRRHPHALVTITGRPARVRRMHAAYRSRNR